MNNNEKIFYLRFYIKEKLKTKKRKIFDEHYFFSRSLIFFSECRLYQTLSEGCRTLMVLYDNQDS
jgi:hypothetical protein